MHLKGKAFGNSRVYLDAMFGLPSHVNLQEACYKCLAEISAFAFVVMISMN